MITIFEGFRFDTEARHLARGNESVPLTPLAYRLLQILLERRPDALSKEELHERLWPGTYVSDANLANLISDLRRAFGDDGRTIVRTIHRFGYAFGAEATDVARTPHLEIARKRSQ
ncbi:MAG: winged helix-turn-helix domain-containing protein [Thermoanaerobaculia bacterium]